MILSEKLRPKKFEEVIGNEEIVSILKDLVRVRGDIPNLLFYGPPGTGKTTLAYIVARELLKEHFDHNFLETNASVDRGIDIVRNRIKDFASTAPLGSKIRILLLDEMESLTPDSMNALRRTMELYPRCRFILTANNVNRIIEPLRSRCLNLPFKKIHPKEMKQVVTRIAQQLKLKFKSPAEIELLVSLSNNDLRHLMNSIQALSSISDTIDQTKIRNLFGMPESQEILKLKKLSQFQEIREAINDLLDRGISPRAIIKELLNSSTTTEEIKKLSEVDYRIAVGGIPELHLLDFFVSRLTNPTELRAGRRVRRK